MAVFETLPTPGHFVSQSAPLTHLNLLLFLDVSIDSLMPLPQARKRCRIYRPGMPRRGSRPIRSIRESPFLFFTTHSQSFFWPPYIASGV
jgi:hypothetical protein